MLAKVFGESKQLSSEQEYKLLNVGKVVIMSVVSEKLNKSHYGRVGALRKVFSALFQKMWHLKFS